MKISTQENIAAPAGAVFDMLCEFSTFEKAAEARGATVERTDSLPEPGTGMTWKTRFVLRGRPREMELAIVGFSRPHDLVFSITSPGLTGQVTFELDALTPDTTRMTAGVDLRAQTLPARLLVQSLKLNKNSLTAKYQQRVAEHVRGMEERYAQSLAGGA
ncbi:SRPBCC family protein [uncultured Roseobacter sp.]|uniref:SRPBCC family protein n=1 Tax=uncultured Roseobacter sp. TaxID=114847 RepID=UPI0026361C6D|nr:SRPBCC family protein [uncultured Roseobacter sp.]